MSYQNHLLPIRFNILVVAWTEDQARRRAQRNSTIRVYLQTSPKRENPQLEREGKEGNRLGNMRRLASSVEGAR
jgi:hypothetical protein